MGPKLAEHFGYVSDQTRLGLFRAAIDAVVAPGSRIADLGCGSGILGLMCLRAGAAHVHFVDEGGMLDVARVAMERAGLSERCSFERARSEQVELCERADVVICDHVGWFGIDYGLGPLLRDARQRHLRPGGSSIPSAVRLHVALVESPLVHRFATQWGGDDVPPEYRWLRDSGVNRKYPVQLDRQQLLGMPADLGVVDFCAENADFLSFSAVLPVMRDGVVQGLGGWFDCELAPNVWMTNSPLAENRIQRPQAFLPIDQAVPVHAGDRVAISVMARPADDLMAWSVAFPREGRVFRHSTWQGEPVSREFIARLQLDYVPRPRAAALAREIVLGYCDGSRTSREIEQAVLRDHPHLLPSEREARRFVSGVLSGDAD